MPYIEPAIREMLGGITFDDVTDPVASWPLSEGEATYCIYKIMLGMIPDNPRFSNYAKAIGAAECAKLEMYRRSVGALEDEKIQENGDIT